MAKLVLGNDPDELEVQYVFGDPFSCQLTLKQSGIEIAWPSAPVLEFPAGAIEWDSILSDGTVPDSVATWNIDEADVAIVHALSSKKVRLSVAGLTWFAGVALNRG